MTIFEHKMKSILREINSFNKPVLIIHGNHESEENLKEDCKKHKNLIFLHKKFFEKENIILPPKEQLYLLLLSHHSKCIYNTYGTLEN